MERPQAPVICVSVEEVTQKIYEEWKSGMYNASRIWAGEFENDRRTACMFLTDKGVSVAGPFGQCEKMYLLQSDLERLLAK